MAQHSTRATSPLPGASLGSRLPQRFWPVRLVLVAALLLAVPFLFDAGSTVHAADNEVSGVIVTSPNPGELLIAWDAPSRAPDDYRVTWKKSTAKWPSGRNENTAEGGNAFVQGTSHTVFGLEEGAAYQVRVRARYFDVNDNLTESGPWSAPPVEVTVSSQLPSAENRSDKEQVPPRKSKKSSPLHDNLSYRLNELIRQNQSQGASPGNRVPRDGGAVEESATVVVYVEAANVQDVALFLRNNGARVRSPGVGDDYLVAEVPVSLLPRLSQRPDVEFVKVDELVRESGGPGATAHGAAPWDLAGYDGTGVKVGVIDAGFAGYSALVGAHLPQPEAVRCWTSRVDVQHDNLADCEAASGSDHGTAVTEMLFDVAPGATYYLTRILNKSHAKEAVDWLIEQGVDVINMSLAVAWDGPGDGTSPYSSSILKTVDTAVDSGALFSATAGNQGSSSWFGKLEDSDGDNVLEFTTGDECNLVTLVANEAYRFDLRWKDDWYTASTDLDTRLTGPGGVGAEVASGGRSQDGTAFSNPLERMSYTPTVAGDYCFVVDIQSGHTIPTWAQLVIDSDVGLDIEHTTNTHSIDSPGDTKNAGALTVGAAAHDATTTINIHSGRGPLPDGTIKPDIVGAHGVSSRAYGHAAYGTSFSAPHVAGLAAVLKERFPDYTPSEIATYLKDNALARGSPTPNNTWGHGFAHLPANPPSQPVVKGRAEVGQALEVNTSTITDGDGITTATANSGFSVQWILVNSDNVHKDIDSATSSTYTITAGDRKHRIKARVSFTDDAGNDEATTSEATSVVNSEPTGILAIDGMARIGRTLTAQVLKVEDPDGVVEPYTYQWVRVDRDDTETDISTATSSTYRLTNADAGHRIKFKLGFTDGIGSTETLESELTTTVGPDLLVGNTGQTTVTTSYISILPATASTPTKVAQSFTTGSADGYLITSLKAFASAGTPTVEIWDDSSGAPGNMIATLTNPDSIPSSTVPDQLIEFSAADVSLVGGTTYWVLFTLDSGQIHVRTTTLTDEDDGSEEQWAIGNDFSAFIHEGTAWETGMSDQSESGPVMIQVIGVVLNSNDEPVGDLLLSGAAQVGEVLTVDASNVSDPNGLADATFEYQWVRIDGDTETDIGSATGASYTLTGDDEGKRIKVEVTYTDDAGYEENLVGVPTQPVRPQDGIGIMVTNLYQESSGTTFADANFPHLMQAFDTGDNADGYTLNGVRVGAIAWDDGVNPVVSITEDGVFQGKSAPGPVLYTMATTTAISTDKDNPSVNVDFAAGDVYLAPNTRYWVQFFFPGRGAGKLYVGVTPEDDEDFGAAPGWTIADFHTFTTPANQRNPLRYDDGIQLRIAVLGKAGAGNRLPEGQPAISGEAQVNEVLTADISGITDGDGLTMATYTYQWVRVDGATDTNIRDATSQTYTLTEDDQGKQFRVRVSFSDDRGYSATISSRATQPVRPEGGHGIQVSNAGQDTADLVGVTGQFPLGAVSFTTGGHSGGYRLNSVRVAGIVNDDGATPKVSLYSDVSGGPGTVLHALTVPSGIPTGATADPAPAELTADTAVLATHTTYWVVFERTASSANFYLRFTDSTDDDFGAASGWSLGDGLAFQRMGNPTWVKGGLRGSRFLFQITVKATPVVDICSRTAEVQTAILASVGGGRTCSTITDTDLASIGSLRITGYSAESIVPADFAGLTSLSTLTITASPDLNTVPENAFSQVSGVETVQLSDTSISSIHENAFDGLTGLSTLFLSSNSLTTLPADIFDGLTGLNDLYLNSNSLTTLPADVFDGLTGLNNLYLNSNSLTTLPADVFDGLTRLSTLQLSSNSLTTLPADIFDSLTELTRLELSSNSLATLPADVFDGPKKAKTLQLSSNSLTTLPADVFDGLTGLTGLYLDSNSLTTLPADVFDGLTGLTTLYLNSNSLTTLPADVFDGLTELRRLDLSANSLAALVANLFDGLTGLRSLDLSANSVTTLPADVFDGLTGLGLLDLECNFLTELSLDRFDPFSGTLTSLDIRGNRFTTPPSETAIRAKLTSLTTLLTGTSMSCEQETGLEVSFGAATYTAAEGGSVTVTVELSADPERMVTIPLTATNQDGATSGDYSGVPGSVAFSATETSKTFAFSATDDSVDDDDESVRLGFGTLPTDVSAGTPSTSTVRITDDDDPSVTVSFGAAAYTAAEGGSVSVEVTLSADPEREVIIPLTATNQDGASDADYSRVPANVTFGATETSKTFTFRATQDSVDDDDESVLLRFGTLPALVTAVSPSTSTVRITDDDVPAVTVSFGSATYSVGEGGSVIVTVALSAAPERPVTVPIIATRRGGATRGDYSGVPANVAFRAGEESKTFTFSATQDTVDDDDESVLLSFGTLPALVTAGSTSSSAVRITDDDDPEVTVSFGASTYTVAEGDDVTVTVELSAAPERSVTIPIAKSNLDRASDADYSSVPASVTFGATETSKTFTFSAEDDSVDDDDERVRLGFGTLPTDVSAGTPSTATVRITDDDDPAVTVSFGAAAYTAAEGGSVSVEVTLSADPEREVIIPLTRSNQDGASNGDYSGVPANVTFGATETSKTFTFSATQDSVDDDDESVLLGFGAMLPTLVTAVSPTSSTVRIRDDDDPTVTVSFGAAAYTVAEGGSVIVTVELSAAPERSVTIPITRSNQDGASNGDYSGVPANVTFGATETSKTFTFSATDDSVDDDDESVGLGFGALPARVSPGSQASSTVRITDDDVPVVTVSFSQAAYTAAEGGGVIVTVTLSAAPERSVTIPITRSNQDGASNGDYSGVPANVTFGATETSKTFTFSAEDDSVDDDDESVLLRFGTLPTGVSTGTPSTATVRITDDDHPSVTVSFGQGAYSVAEGDDVTVTVELSADPERSVTIPLTATNQSGATSADYSGVPADVTFTSGEESRTFTFSAAQDVVDDDGERVLLGFATLPALVTAGGTATSTVSITDNDDPAVTVSFRAASYTAAEGGSVTVTVELSADPERTVTVPITATNQDGATRADYSGVPADVTFSSGDRSETFTFSATQDTVDDDDESVLLGFGAMPARVSPGSQASSTVRITDDDDPEVTVSFSQAAYTAAEGGGVIVTVTLSAAPERSVTIPLSATNQDGATSADYSRVPANVAFGASETSKTFTFSATQDTVDDDGESVLLGFGAMPARVSPGSQASSTVRITDDDDPAVTVSFRAATYTVAEGDDVTVTVELSADPERSVTIPLRATGEDGATTADYSGVPRSVTFSSGDTSETFTFSATQDSIDDDDESVLLRFGTLPALVTAVSPSSSAVRIMDDDDPAVTVSFGAATYAAAEGGRVTVTVRLSAAPERSVTIPITRTEQDGASSRDYSEVTASVTFGASETSKTFTFSATDDSVDDDGESVLLGFGTLPARVSPGSQTSSTVRITDDDDPAVTVSFGQAAYSVAEGGSVIVTVDLSAAPERSVTIPLSATNQGGATSADYSSVPPNVAFSATETSKTFTFAATDDSVDDDDERVLLRFGTLPAGVSAGTPSMSTVNITDDDGSGVTIRPPSLEIDEGATGTYTVVLDSAPTADVTVTPSIASGAGFSFTPPSLTFTMDNWDSGRTVTVSGTSDADALDHTGVIAHAVASTDSNYRGTAASVSVTVMDTDDVPVTVTFEQRSYEVAEGSSVTVKVLLSADPDRTVTIPVTRSNEGTTTEDDYSGVPDDVTFDAGDTEASFTFVAAQDTDDDDGESVLLGFGALPNAVTAGMAAETTLSIGDDDDPVVTASFEHATYTANEGGSVTVTVVLSAEPEREVIIPLTTRNEGGADDDDYAGVPASVTFNAGDTEQTFTFTATDDTVDDGGESVLLGFGALPARVSGGGTATVDIADDDTRGVKVEPTQLTFGEGRSGTYTVVLNTRPTGTVTVTVNDPTDNTDVTAEPPSLTFTPDDWESAQTVTVTAVQDGDTNTDAATVTHSVSGGDYNLVAAADVTVTVIEEARSTPPAGGGGGGGGGPTGPSPSEVDFEWTVKHDIDELDGAHDKPSGMWSDGTTLWILENGDGADDAVYAYDLKTGERLEQREFELAETNRAPRGLWSNRTIAWVADSGRDRLFAYDLESGERDEAREIVLAERNRDARGLWSDGMTIWVLDGGKDSLFAYDLASGELLAEYALHDANGDPHGLWSDGVSVWVSDHGAKRHFAYRLPEASGDSAVDDAEVTSLERVNDEEFTELSKASNNSPRGLWSDGDVMYVADESDDKVYSYNMPDALDARLASLTLSGVDIGEFDRNRTDYEGTPDEGATQTTVTAEALQRRTDVAIDPPDANEEADGHQVALEGLNEITVSATSADESRTKVYRVRFGEEEAAGSAAACLRGAVTVGFNLVVYGGGSVEDLVACAEGRSVTALYALDGGTYISYILGAPEFVNAGFLALFADGVPALTPLTVKSEGPPSPAPASDGVPEFGLDCLRGEIAAGFNLVTYEGGSVEDLDTCAASREVSAVYALVEGEYVPYILGAPGFVNEAFVAVFPDGLPALTPLVAKSPVPTAGASQAGGANR